MDLAVCIIHVIPTAFIIALLYLCSVLLTTVHLCNKILIGYGSRISHIDVIDGCVGESLLYADVNRHTRYIGRIQWHVSAEILCLDWVKQGWSTGTDMWIEWVGNVDDVYIDK